MNSKNLPIYPLFFSLVITTLFFIIHRNVGLDFADEGFLWYGVERVLKGETPILDFHSYDPGRYYWSALWFRLWRPGLVPLRFSETFFEFFGIFFGLWAVQKYFPSLWELAGLGLLLGLWMFPDYKFFDCCLPLLAVWVGIKFLNSTKPYQTTLTWVFVGLTFWIGQNHGLYLSIAFFFLTLEKYRQTPSRRLIWFYSLGGWLLGLLPFVCLGIIKPGFLRTYFSIDFQMLQSGTTNLSLPIPWFWTLFQNHAETSSYWFLLAATNLLPLAYLLWICQYWKNRKNLTSLNQSLLACALIGIPYLHYFFSRCDLQHLAVAISPFWLGLSIWVSRKSVFRLWEIPLIIISFFWITAPYHLFKIKPFDHRETVQYKIGPDKIWLRPDQADFLKAVTGILKYEKPGQSFLALPHLTTLYAVFNLKSPCWQNYPVLKSSIAEQNKMIKEMKLHHVRWALIDNFPLDQRDDLKFKNIDPLVWKYITSHYRLFPHPINYVYDSLFFNPHASDPLQGPRESVHGHLP